MTRADRRNAWREQARVGSPRRLPAWARPILRYQDGYRPVQPRGKVYDRAGKR